MAHKLASSYKLTDELFYFVHLIGNQKMNEGDYNQAEKLFQDAYAMRDNISKDNKVGFNATRLLATSTLSNEIKCAILKPSRKIICLICIMIGQNRKLVNLIWKELMKWPLRHITPNPTTKMQNG